VSNEPAEAAQDESTNWDWWWSSWRNLIRCDGCEAFTEAERPCPMCGKLHIVPGASDFVQLGGTRVPRYTFRGPLDWSPYVMLQMMHREWTRPLHEFADPLLPIERTPSQRAVIVLIFWAYFETLMTTFYERATSHLPPNVGKDLLKRYQLISHRLDRLHKVLFGCRLGDDLDNLDFKDVHDQLERIGLQRNSFAHGEPEAIDDSLVAETVRLLPRFHEAWIEVFNRRCAAAPGSR
jgi:hypothetical protein